MKPGAALTVLSIAAAIVAQLRFLPGEAKEVSVSYADGGVVNLPQAPSARFAGTSAARDPRRAGVMTAQRGHGARDDGAAARSDALMGTPNKKTPVPQDNRFSTSPRLEQQPPATDPPAPRGATPAPLVTPR
ncbi:MAG TPA: hypothetical protein VFO32_10860 [Sphingomicrobium sp.]|nr:hypothetical protein [Sphingomicrobium sp.]